MTDHERLRLARILEDMVLLNPAEDLPAVIKNMTHQLRGCTGECGHCSR